MAVLRGHLEAGELTPIVDRTSALDEVAGALRYLQSGQAVGKITIRV